MPDRTPTLYRTLDAGQDTLATLDAGRWQTGHTDSDPLYYTQS